MVGTADIIADRLGGVGAEEDRAGITDAKRQRLGVGRHDLQMLGGDGVGERHGLIELFHQDDGAVIVPGFSRDLRTGQGGELRFDGARDVVGEPGIVGDQDRLRVHVVLGLRQQVGGDPVGIAGVVGDHQHLGGAGDHVDADFPEHEALGGGDIGIAGADDLGHRRDGGGAIGQSGHGLRAADAIDLGDAAEMGGRLEATRFGYRVNVAAERLRSYIKGADGNRKFISGAFDWQISPQALLQLDADYQDKAQVTAPGFQLLSNGSLPANVSADTMLNKQPWTHPVETVTSNLGLRFQYAFNDDWHATLSANQHSFKRDDYTAYPYGCSPEGWNPVFCSNGDFSVWDFRSLGETKKPLSAQAMLQGKFATGSLRHEFTAGVSYFNRKDRAGLYVYDEVGISNIYHPVVVAPSTGVTGPVRLVRNDKEKSVFVQDIVSLGQNWKLHGGLRHIDVDGYQYVLKAATEIRAKHDFLLPNVALVYNPQDNIAVYASYSHGMEHGGTADRYANNANVELTPSRSKQLEFGVKADVTPDLMVAASLFQIRKGLEFNQYLDSSMSTYNFVRAGQAQHRGLELSAQGKASANLSLGASLTALNSQQSGTGNADLDGKRVPNVPALKAAVRADYAVPQVAGLNVNGSWEYAGKKAFEFNNTTFVPSYSVFNLGAAYATRLAGTPAVLRATVNNVTDKFYWRDVTPDAGGYLFPGASRTFKVSAQFDF